MATEEIFVEKSSRPSVLVVEDNIQSAEMAKACLKADHDVSVAHTLKDAASLLDSRKFDFILSDVMFPTDKGCEETDNTKAMLNMALKKAVPIAFVTMGDHHGMITELMKKEKPQVSIKCLSLKDIHNSLFLLSRKQAYLKTDFNCIVSGYSKVMDVASKDMAIWTFAIINLKNVSARSSPVSGAMRKVKDTLGEGLGFEFKNGAITLTDSRIRR
jgi:CheY-like chemotaxis protein